MENKNFNLILTGVGGQGLITLLHLIDDAALIEGHDVKSSELHGLSQRGGSVEAHVRFGKKVYSPMVADGEVDLIMGFEVLEAVRRLNKAGKNTKLLVNEYFFPLLDYPPKEELIGQLKDSKKDLYLVAASNECQEKLQNGIVSTLYLLGYAVANKLIPLKKESVISSIKNNIPQKYLDINIKAFELGYDK